MLVVCLQVYINFNHWVFSFTLNKRKKNEYLNVYRIQWFKKNVKIVTNLQIKQTYMKITKKNPLRHVNVSIINCFEVIFSLVAV